MLGDGLSAVQLASLGSHGLGENSALEVRPSCGSGLHLASSATESADLCPQPLPLPAPPLLPLSPPRRERVPLPG